MAIELRVAIDNCCRVKAIPWDSYSNEVKLYINVLKKQFDMAQVKRIGLDQNGNPICFLGGHVRACFLLDLSQHFE